MLRRFMLALIIAAPLSASAQPPDGADLWRRNCAKCHGEDGHGKTELGRKLTVPDLTRPMWQEMRDDGQIRSIIAIGSESGMPGFQGKLSAAEVDALVKVVRGFKAAKPAQAPTH